MDATAILLLLSESPSGGTAVLLRRAVPPDFVVMGDDTLEGFARLRRGSIAYGVQELYQALPRDMIQGGHTLHVRDDHRRARVDVPGSLFGPAPEKLWVPLDDDGQPYERTRIPIPSLAQPAYVEFAFVGWADDVAQDGANGAFGGVLEYALQGEAQMGDGYICPYCGKLCEQKEPHTAAHGVAGSHHSGIPTPPGSFVVRGV
ncbi:hypothetical protein [Humibacter ginsengiterrae]